MARPRREVDGGGRPAPGEVSLPEAVHESAPRKIDKIPPGFLV